MPYCPECKYEYVPGIKDCPDCRVPLVEKLAEEKSPEEAWAGTACVGEYEVSLIAELAKSRLESEGIECFLTNDIVNRLKGEVYPNFMGGIRLMVSEKDAARALEILSSVDESEPEN